MTLFTHSVVMLCDNWIISHKVLQLNIAFLKAFDSIVGLSTDGDVKLHESYHLTGYCAIVHGHKHSMFNIAIHSGSLSYFDVA